MIATAVENKKTAWLGKFPAHWEVLRIKNLFQEMDSRSETGSEELLSVSHYTGVTLKRESLENEDDHLSNAESLVGYKLVAKNDLVINIMLAWNGSLGISPRNGMTSPAYCVYRIKGDNNPEYFGYLFTTNLFKAEFRRNSTGIIDSRLRLYSDKFFSIFTVVPPKDEQEEIVQYIKAQEEKINLFIQKKQRFIELLKEQRLRVITLAVTKGINNEKLKDSEINWLGEMPLSWERTALKRFVKIKITDGPHESPVFADEGIPFVSAEASVNGKIDLKRKRCDISRELHEEYCKKAKAEFGDILMVKSGSTTGKIAIVDFYDEFSIWSPLALIRPNDTVNNEYLFYSLSSNYFQKQVQLNWSFGTQPNIGMGKIEQLVVLFPSSIEEQKQIVAHIKTETATIDTAIAKAEREIELIREYKEAMISEAVMGNRK
jgi:type I restriction enzyme S subunit